MPSLRIALALVLLLLPGAAFAKATVLIFGDSIVAGHRLKPGETLPDRLQENLDKMGLDIQIINGGMPNETTSNGQRRLEWMLDSHTPDAVLLALGVNDVLRGIPPDTIYRNIDTMLSMLRKRGIYTILMSIKIPSSRNPTYTGQINVMYPDLAKRHRAALYPFFLEPIAGNANYMLKDGKYPNARGVVYIAKYLTEYLASEMQRIGAIEQGGAQNEATQTEATEQEVIENEGGKKKD